jgi:hypothetical protein
VVQQKEVFMYFEKCKTSGLANRLIMCKLQIQTNVSQQRMKVFGYERADEPKKCVKTFVESNRF